VTGRWHWWVRIGLVVAVAGGLTVTGILLELEPEPVRVFAVVALVAALAGIVVDSVPDQLPTWKVDHVRRGDIRGRDARTAGNLWLLESHLSSRHAEPHLRDRLARLAEQNLSVRHGVAPETARARELMGPELTAVVTGPPRRLRREEIERCVTRIEQL
jgi:hypothetical protein